MIGPVSFLGTNDRAPARSRRSETGGESRRGSSGDIFPRLQDRLAHRAFAAKVPLYICGLRPITISICAA